jgi:structural maintenance of chromosome 1
MDAISFVLGIKSSHLRSAHLRDLVYRGRVLKSAKLNDDGSAAPATNGHSNGVEDDGEVDARASRNDPKTAWVMAVYEDDAGDEQKWKRSITSAGASEYRINDRVVTAQQYNEALEAENILIKARNFLVFQGDVEAIASQSPQDLTRLIEQISGSLEYKAEYEKLQGEVDQATENQNYQLHRRRGINSEIKQYQEQKKEAENFQKKTEERDEAVVTQLLWRLYHYQRVMDESSEAIREHQENMKEFRRNVETFEKKLEAARKEQTAAAREVGKLERGIKAKEKNIEDKENQLVPIDEKVQQSERELQVKKSRIETTRAQFDDENGRIQKLKKDLAAVEKSEQQFENEWREKMKKTGKELSDADRKEYTNLRAQVMAKAAQNQGKLDNLNRQLKGDEATVNSLKGKVDSHQGTVQKLQAELDRTTERRTRIIDSIGALERDLKQKKTEFNEVRSERVRIEHSRTELEEKLQDIRNKLNEADDGRRQNDREAKMKEMVSNLRRIYPGVRGRVAELCKPKQKKFDEAVATALGHDMKSVVVDTEKIGIDCVQYLKEQRFAPMTFIPLDNIKVNAVNSAVKGIPGARLTIDTLDFDASVERAIAYACGSSVICDTEEIAKDICYERRLGVKAVTLGGMSISKAGLISGGRTPEQRGRKGQFDEVDIEKLRKEDARLKEQREKLPQLERRAATEDALKQDMNLLESKLAFAREEKAAFDKNVKSVTASLTNETKQLSIAEAKFREKDDELTATKATVAKFDAAIASVQDKIFAGFCKRLGYADIRAYEAQQGSLEAQAAEERTRFSTQKQRLRSNIEWQSNNLKDLETRLSTLQQSLKNLQQAMQKYARERDAIQKSLDAERDELGALEETLEAAQARYAARVEKAAEAKQEVQKRSKEIDERGRQINALEAEVQKNSASKFALLRRCKLEQIAIPLAHGSLDDIPNEDVLLQKDRDAMDVDEEDEEEEEAEELQKAMDDHGLEVDYSGLDEELRAVSPHCAASWARPSTPGQNHTNITIV